MSDNKARRYVVNRTRGKAKKYMDVWARLEAKNKQEMTTKTKKQPAIRCYVADDKVRRYVAEPVERGRKICGGGQQQYVNLVMAGESRAMVDNSDKQRLPRWTAKVDNGQLF